MEERKIPESWIEGATIFGFKPPYRIKSIEEGGKTTYVLQKRVFGFFYKTHQYHNTLEYAEKEAEKLEKGVSRAITITSTWFIFKG